MSAFGGQFSKRRYGEIVREKKSHNGFEAPNELKLVCHLAFKNVLFSFFLFFPPDFNELIYTGFYCFSLLLLLLMLVVTCTMNIIVQTHG